MGLEYWGTRTNTASAEVKRMVVRNEVSDLAVGASIVAVKYVTDSHREAAHPRNSRQLQKTGPKATQVLPQPAAPSFSPEDTCVIFVLGGPGVGKGTQCAKLVDEFGFVHLSAGDLLRAEQIREGSQYGELIKSYIKEGKIVPMEVTIALLENAMRESKSKRFLIDGFPRKLDQALKFEESVVESKFTLFFECSEQTMLKRLIKRGETSGRDDDNIESIRKRFRTFEQTSMPAVEYFRQKNKVLTVDCEKSIEEVYEQVRKNVLKALQTSAS